MNPEISSAKEKVTKLLGEAGFRVEFWSGEGKGISAFVIGDFEGQTTRTRLDRVEKVLHSLPTPQKELISALWPVTSAERLEAKRLAV